MPTWDDTQVVIQPLGGGPRTLLIDSGADARYIPHPGHIVYMRRGTLLAAPFNLEQRRITGGSVAVVSDVMQAANVTNTMLDSGVGQFSISASGSLIRAGRRLRLSQSGCLSGSIERAGSSRWTAPPRINYPRLSPDGNRIAVSTQGDRNVWMYSIARGTTGRITVDGRNMAPAWTPDSQANHLRLVIGRSGESVLEAR